MMFSSIKKQYITPYDITACWRGVFYERKNVPKPILHPDITRMLDHFRTLADTGRKVHAYVTRIWRERGTLISSEHALPKNAWGIRGKFDAICRENDTQVLVEIKSASAGLYEWYKETGNALPSHRIQLLTYYLVMREHFPDLLLKILYVNRATRRACTLPIIPTEKELCVLIEKIETLQRMCVSDELPPCVPAIEPDLINGTPTISMTAMTCRYHSLCLQNDAWYEDAKAQVIQKIKVH